MGMSERTTEFQPILSCTLHGLLLSVLNTKDKIHLYSFNNQQF